MAFPPGVSWCGVCFDPSGGPCLGGLPLPHCRFRRGLGSWGGRSTLGQERGRAGPTWSRQLQPLQVEGMPAVRSSSFLSSRTVIAAAVCHSEHLPESSSSTRMAKTSGTMSAAWFTACGSPTWFRRGCGLSRGVGPRVAESAPGVGGQAALGSGRMVPSPGGVAASAASSWPRRPAPSRLGPS